MEVDADWLESLDWKGMQDQKTSFWRDRLETWRLRLSHARGGQSPAMTAHEEASESAGVIVWLGRVLLDLGGYCDRAVSGAADLDRSVR